METRIVSRGERNNNPLNIRVSNNAWFGKMTSQDGIFEYFIGNYFGYRAAYLCLLKHYNRGYCTIEKLINKWAPNSENPTSDYIRFVSKNMNIRPDVRLDWSYSYVFFLMYYMCVFENGYIIDRPALSDVCLINFTK